MCVCVYIYIHIYTYNIHIYIHTHIYTYNIHIYGTDLYNVEHQLHFNLKKISIKELFTSPDKPKFISAMKHQAPKTEIHGQFYKPLQMTEGTCSQCQQNLRCMKSQGPSTKGTDRDSRLTPLLFQSLTHCYH